MTRDAESFDHLAEEVLDRLRRLEARVAALEGEAPTPAEPSPAPAAGAQSSTRTRYSLSSYVFAARARARAAQSGESASRCGYSTRIMAVHDPLGRTTVS